MPDWFSLRVPEGALVRSGLLRMFYTFSLPFRQSPGSQINRFWPDALTGGIKILAK